MQASQHTWHVTEHRKVLLAMGCLVKDSCDSGKKNVDPDCIERKCLDIPFKLPQTATFSVRHKDDSFNGAQKEIMIGRAESRFHEHGTDCPEWTYFSANGSSIRASLPHNYVSEAVFMTIRKN
jgi:hypothetical protein